MSLKLAIEQPSELRDYRKHREKRRNNMRGDDNLCNKYMYMGWKNYILWIRKRKGKKRKRKKKHAEEEIRLTKKKI